MNVGKIIKFWFKSGVKVLDMTTLQKICTGLRPIDQDSLYKYTVEYSYVHYLKTCQ